MANILTYLEYGFYFGMLFFFVPLKVNNTDDTVKDQFNEYLRNFNKKYENDSIYSYRLQAFKNSLEVIQNLNTNRSNGSAVYGLTKFSDLYPEEFFARHLSNTSFDFVRKGEDSHEDSREKRDVNKNSDYPQKFDWRTKNVVTKVKNQNSCGACWAFSTIETIESMAAIKYGNLHSLSVQQMIDCSTYNRGCEGGDMCRLLQWILLNNIKITSEANYPLDLSSNHCHANDSLGGIEVDTYYCEDFINNEEVMLEIIALIGPITVAVNARMWQNYAGGIIQFHCDGDIINLNHAVQIVGYDMTNDIPHYIVRNTWGEDFGENGYMYIAVGNNTCGVANKVVTLKVL